jgi:hypothetical protein
MTQATTFSVPTTGPASPDVFATRIDDNFTAALTGHSGASRPAYAVAGTVWQDTSVAGTTKFYFYDGTDDILLWTVNTSTNATDLKWLSKAVGEFYWADDGVTGVDIPPSSTSGSTVWVELTSGLTGSGQFNQNKLTSESVSGSAPLVLATAVVSLSGSPMNGQTIRLLNTERRMLRAGSAGTLQDDALQNVTGTLSGTQESFFGTGAFTTGSAGAANRPNNGTAGTFAANFALANDSNARTATETRMKNIGVRVFRRIK